MERVQFQVFICILKTEVGYTDHTVHTIHQIDIKVVEEFRGDEIVLQLIHIGVLFDSIEDIGSIHVVLSRSSGSWGIVKGVHGTMDRLVVGVMIRRILLHRSTGTHHKLSIIGHTTAVRVVRHIAIVRLIDGIILVEGIVVLVVVHHRVVVGFNG